MRRRVASVSGTGRDGQPGQRSAADARSGEHLAAARCSARRFILRHWHQRLVLVDRNRQRLAACRSRAGASAPVDADRIRHRDRSLFCSRARAGGVRCGRNGGSALRCCVSCAAASHLSGGGDAGGTVRRLRDGRTEDRKGCARRAGAADVFGGDEGLCRNPRGARAHRSLRAACGGDGTRHATPPSSNESGCL